MNTDVRETGIKETLDKMYSETDCIKFMEDIFSKVYTRKLKMTAAPEKHGNFLDVVKARFCLSLKS